VRTVGRAGGARWAPASGYGESIVKDYLAGLLATKAPEEDAGEVTRLQEENKLLAQRLADTIQEIEGLRDKLNQIRAIIFR